MMNKNYIMIIRTEKDLEKLYEKCSEYTTNKNTPIPEIVISIPDIPPVKCEFFHMCGVDTIYKAVNDQEITEICNIIANERKDKQKTTTKYKVKLPIHFTEDDEMQAFENFLVSALEEYTIVPEVVVALGPVDEDYASFALEHGVKKFIYVETPKKALDTIHKETLKILDRCMTYALDKIFSALEDLK